MKLEGWKKTFHLDEQEQGFDVFLKRLPGRWDWLQTATTIIGGSQKEGPFTVTQLTLLTGFWLFGAIQLIDLLNGGFVPGNSWVSVPMYLAPVSAAGFWVFVRAFLSPNLADLQVSCAKGKMRLTRSGTEVFEAQLDTVTVTHVANKLEFSTATSQYAFLVDAPSEQLTHLVQHFSDYLSAHGALSDVPSQLRDLRQSERN